MQLDHVDIAFIDELDKIGLNIPALTAGVSKFVNKGGLPLAVAGVGGALMAYDWIKANRIKGDVFVEDIVGDTRGAKKVDSEEYIKELEKEDVVDRPLVPVVDAKGIQKFMRDPNVNIPGVRDILKEKAQRVVTKGDNAFMFQGKGKDFIVVAPKANPRIIEHEVGHSVAESGKGMSLVPKILQRIKETFWKPSFRAGRFREEQDAWNVFKKRTPLKERALATYERGFHRRRSDAVNPVVVASLLAGIERGLEASIGG